MITHIKASLLAVCTMLLFVTCNLHAELVAIPALQTHVTDLAQTLTTEQQSQLEAKFKAFELEKGSQIAVLIVPSTKPEEIEQYSIRVVDAWKLGREKQDDGILILVAKNDHKMRIEVGQGLEGAIPDLIAKRVISEVMSPSFKQGDFYGGINNAADKLMGLISGEKLAPPLPQASHANMSFDNSLALFVVGCLVVGAFLSSVLGRLFGAGATAGIIGGVSWFILGTLGMSIFVGIMAFVFTLIMPYIFDGTRGGGTYSSGGYGGGGFGSGGGNDSFSGGGGGFSGGGASGDW
ncbi:YgcG family protein [Methylotenera sp.]|uniref:TPM domain-containing protein n=1 Tax=Methylotenera sp. TaxID=2051956 RepID=UPI00248A3B05|nr:YgcG family protein [Methylotenera sp.]MDI1298109.1 YgcG family protein [Methylotenera sp.]